MRTMPESTISGRKYKLSRLCIGVGFVVCMTGILLTAWKQENPGKDIATQVGEFANILMVSVAMFSAADATITSVAAWKAGRQVRVEESHSKTVSGIPDATQKESEES